MAGTCVAGIMGECMGQRHLSAWEHSAWQLSSVLRAQHLGIKQTFSTLGTSNCDKPCHTAASNSSITC
ncbi:hypothetical protein ABBQ32_012740 [Trebouxia sp. C0010 RCD-2024]